VLLQGIPLIVFANSFSVASLQATSVTRSVVPTPVKSSTSNKYSGGNRLLPSHFIVYSYKEYESLVSYIVSNSHNIFRDLDHHRTQSTLLFYHHCPDLSWFQHHSSSRHSDKYEEREKEDCIIGRSESISKTSEESPLTSRERIRDMERGAQAAYEVKYQQQHRHICDSSSSYTSYHIFLNGHNEGEA
jgi:hypothetical protein